MAGFPPILFILAGKKHMHESSEEFEIWQGSTTDCGVSCSLVSEKIPIDLIMGKRVLPFFSQLSLIGSFSYLQGTMTYIRAWMSSKFSQMQPRTKELPALEHLKFEVATFSRLFFIQSFSYVMMKCMRARRSSKFGQMRPLTADLAALERWKKSP